MSTGAFSNSEEWWDWEAVWCGRCLRDAPQRSRINLTGCPILASSLRGAPPQWVLPDPEAGGTDYTCLAMRPRGTAADGGPVRHRPGRPPVKGMLPLFPMSKAGPAVLA